MDNGKVVYLKDIRHGVRVAEMSVLIAKKLGRNEKVLEDIYIAGLFHDIGKAYIDKNILNKPGKLTEDEREVIKKHVVYSSSEVLKMGYSSEISNIILYHHEDYDGGGYPNGIKGEQIPIDSRILKVSDVFDALTSNRVYRGKLASLEAINLMLLEKNKYDPEVMKVLLDYIDYNKLSQTLWGVGNKDSGENINTRRFV